MTAIELLLQRQSTPLLTTPAPDAPDLDNILSAGMRVPDHACLKPWHFTVIQNEGLQRLSNLYVEALHCDAKNQVGLQESQIDMNDAEIKSNVENKIAKTKKMPFRAPMIIVISTQYHEHSKVPKSEQLIAAGCASHAMQMAAVALGYGAMWRTGDFAYNAFVKKGLDIGEGNDIVGFLYLGTASKELPLKPVRDYKEKVTYWS
jgi:nitroreductase